MSFFTEIKRRNLLRVGVAYAVVAWLLLQVSATLVPALLLPEWIQSAVALLLILGFPVALLLAWAYELTPEGLKKEKDVDRSQPTPDNNGRKLNFVIIGLFAAALVYFAFDKFVLGPQRDATTLESTRPASPETPIDRSIAVLAFANMSDDSGNEYFSDGLSEELLNMLVKIPELRVAARTSSFSYKNTDTRIAQIGDELNVTYILEGSVRKAGDRVRITAQLIKADDGFHLWSETFDRNLDDIFAVQDEVAAAVVDSLQVRLLGALPTPQHTNPDVYAFYLRGNFFQNLSGPENLEKAVVNFKQALALDPDYAPAWLALAMAYQYQMRIHVLPRETGVELAMSAVRKALATDNNMATAWSGLAYLRRSYEWDWAGAQTAIDRALQLEPNNPRVLGVAASLANTFGQTSRYVSLFERIHRLDPVRLVNLRALGAAYLKIGRYADAVDTFKQVVSLNPKYPTGYSSLCLAYLVGDDIEKAVSASEKIEDKATKLYYQAIISAVQGDNAKSTALANEFLELRGGHAAVGMANIYAWSGDRDAAFQWLEIAFQQRDDALAFILGAVSLRSLRSDPRYPVFLEKLGLLEAWEAMPTEYGGAPRLTTSIEAES
ncbi:MAG: hypothetical protein GXP15_15035 [Gammaproteobacteria bacterium]|nr:hypothetical protein [Gammaproteobacteria bacterium]